MPPTIAVLGDRDPRHLTHLELDACIELLPPAATARWVATDSPEARRPGDFDALWVAPGTPYRDAGVVIAAIRSAREQASPSSARAAGSSTCWSSSPAASPGWPAPPMPRRTRTRP